MTLTKAIKTARSQTSTPYPFGTQWSVHSYCAIKCAWHEFSPMTYVQAQNLRREFLINKTLIALGMSLDDADYYSQKYNGGSWVEFVRKYAKKIRQENEFKAMFQSIN
jgi:hypothetical protein